MLGAVLALVALGALPALADEPAPLEEPVEGAVVLPESAAPTHTADGVLLVHWSKVRVKNTVQPNFPEAAKALQIEDTACQMRVVVDAAGVPESVSPLECPKVFLASATAALGSWEFHPQEVDGDAVPMAVDITIRYKLAPPVEDAEAPEDVAQQDPAYPHFEFSEVRLRTRVMPRVPDELKERGGVAACTLSVKINEKGRVDEVVPTDDCDEIARESSVDAVSKWVFAKKKDEDKQPFAYSTTVKTHFLVK